MHCYHTLQAMKKVPLSFFVVVTKLQINISALTSFLRCSKLTILIYVLNILIALELFFKAMALQQSFRGQCLKISTSRVRDYMHHFPGTPIPVKVGQLSPFSG